MLGRNHALYAAAAWVGAWPVIAEPVGLPVSDPAVLVPTTLIAAGAGVIPDLDHPDARPSRQFGFLSRVVAKAINKSSGGHRMGTHTVMFAAMLGAVTFACQFFPEYGRPMAAIACGFCASCGYSLMMPSFGFRANPWMALALAGATGAWVWFRFDVVAPGLWVLAAGGVLVHCACDIVTKGGVPVLYPFSKRRFALGWFKVGGTGEHIAAFVGMVGLLVAAWGAIGAIT